MSDLYGQQVEDSLRNTSQPASPQSPKNIALDTLRNTTGSPQSASFQAKRGLSAEERRRIHQRLLDYRKVDPPGKPLYHGQNAQREFNKAWAEAYLKHRQQFPYKPLGQTDLKKIEQQAVCKTLAMGHSRADVARHADQKAITAVLNDKQEVATIQRYEKLREQFKMQGDRRLQSLAIADRRAAIENTNHPTTPAKQYRVDWKERSKMVSEGNRRRDIELTKNHVASDAKSIEPAARMLAKESVLTAQYHRPLHQLQCGRELAVTAYQENIQRAQQARSTYKTREQVYTHSAVQQKAVAGHRTQRDVSSPSAHESSKALLASKGQTQEWFKRAEQAHQTLLNDRTGKLSKGDTLSELQKEHARRLERDGTEKGLSQGLLQHSRHKGDGNIGKVINADRDIAARLYVAGHSKQEIFDAMRKGAPSCANLSEKEFQGYFDRKIKTVLNDPKINSDRENVTAMKAKKGIPNERRLDRLGGATKREDFSQQKTQSQVMQRMQKEERQR